MKLKRLDGSKQFLYGVAPVIVPRRIEVGDELPNADPGALVAHRWRKANMSNGGMG